jgi:hypothetical protein
MRAAAWILAAVLSVILAVPASAATKAAPVTAKKPAWDVTTDIPEQAMQYLPILGQQVKEVMPDFKTPEYFGALIEHESGCPGIKHMCWNPKARLKSSREEGAGLSQITRAYKEDGSIRFDALEETRKLDPRGLNELRWDNVYDRPDLQLRVMVVMTRANYNRVAKLTTDPELRLKLTDLSYNAGFGRVLNDMRACSLTTGCDTSKWNGHVEKTCTASKKPLYGDRSACDICRHHVHDVVETRMPKYKGKV